MSQLCIFLVSSESVQPNQISDNKHTNFHIIQICVIFCERYINYDVLRFLGNQGLSKRDLIQGTRIQADATGHRFIGEINFSISVVYFEWL